MFRYQQKKRMEEHVVSRITSYPLVSDSITQMANLYEKTKQKNALVRYALEKAESVAQTVVATTKEPVLSRYEKQIASINSIALSQLDKLEDKYPIITKPTSEVYQAGKMKYDSSSLKPTVERVIGVTKTSIDKVYDAKNYGIDTAQSMKKYSTEKALNIKDYSLEKVSDALKTPYGQVVVVQMDKFLDVADNYVDYYLPKNEHNNDESEAKDTVSKALNVSTKLLQITHNGLSAAQKRLFDTWEEINKPFDENNEENVDESLERRAILAARRLNAQIKNGMETLTLKAIEAPAYIQDAIDLSSTYSEGLYNYFRKVIHYDETSQQALEQQNTKIVYIRNTLKNVTDYAVSSWPLNSLSSSFSFRFQLAIQITQETPRTQLRWISSSQMEINILYSDLATSSWNRAHRDLRSASSNTSEGEDLRNDDVIMKD